MQTLTHLLTTAIINRSLPQKSIPKHTVAFLMGSILSDIPFAFLTFTYQIYYQWFVNPPLNQYSSVMEYLHFDLFFNDPVWIISHNIFHSLIVNASLVLIGYVALKFKYYWGLLLFWLSGGMLLHTIIDIFTHNSDGPLMFFPLNWTYRFTSPVSYWEADHYGEVVLIVEYVLNMLIVLYFIFVWWKHRSVETN